MRSTFNSQTLNLTQLFSVGRLTIPDYQRRYAWRVDVELEDFWNDLKNVSKQDPYFMGVIILSEDGGRYEVVDGQQRLISLTLLGCAIARIAKQQGQQLVADTINESILLVSDFEVGKKVPRISLRDNEDAQALKAIATQQEVESTPGQDLSANRITSSFNYLYRKLSEDIANGPSNSLNRWTTFLTRHIFVSVFTNPDTETAYRVFEVVNARGKSLTPAEMIKAYVIGSLPESKKNSAVDRWASIESRFRDAGEEVQITQFIRHVLILRKGLVLPRDLYKAVSSEYKNEGVLQLLDSLEEYLDVYMYLVDPSLSSAEEKVSGSFARMATILDTLGLTTVRPAILSVWEHQEESVLVEELAKIIVPRIVTGSFGTGAVEAKFAKFAHTLFTDPDNYQTHLQQLGDLAPTREDFEEKVETRNLNNGVKSVLRHSAIYKSPLPEINRYLHVVHRNRSQEWPGFTLDEFENLSKTIGNSVLLASERRPRNSGMFRNVAERLGPELAAEEFVDTEMLENWTAETVRELNRRLSQCLGEVWFE